METNQYYTNAPEAYDGFGTKTINKNTGYFDRNGNELRIVEILALHNQWQTIRYSSGMKIFFTVDALDEFMDLIVFKKAMEVVA